MRKEEEKSHSIIKEKERRIEELETSLASSQKQIEDVVWIDIDMNDSIDYAFW